MNFKSTQNIARNALKSNMIGEMARKLYLRVFDKAGEAQLKKVALHCETFAINADDWAGNINEALWDESRRFAEAHEKHSNAILETIPVKMGGGGFYALLYFLTRLTKPETVVETGVAAGFSSRAFLLAIEKNGSGKLCSSDFPYFRIQDPEKYIGILVESELKKNWQLFIGSDRVNLPKIVSEIDHIDILHYDSDKSKLGRNFALETLSGCISDKTIIMFDDIQDNQHFIDISKNRKSLIFEFKGKYVGVLVPKEHEALLLT